MNRRETVLAMVLGLVAGASWWLAERASRDTIQLTDELRRPDYFLRNFTTRQYDDQGRIERILRANQLRHYPRDDSTELDQPQLTLMHEQQQWQLSAQQGKVSRGGDLMLLEGEVQIERAAGDGLPPVSVATQDLLVYNKRRMAETGATTRIRSGNSWMEAEGMRLWFGEDARLKLLSKVRGEYAID